MHIDITTDSPVNPDNIAATIKGNHRPRNGRDIRVAAGPNGMARIADLDIEGMGTLPVRIDRVDIRKDGLGYRLTSEEGLECEGCGEVWTDQAIYWDDDIGGAACPDCQGG